MCVPHVLSIKFYLYSTFRTLKCKPRCFTGDIEIRNKTNQMREVKCKTMRLLHTEEPPKQFSFIICQLTLTLS